ncbi:MAG TPA: L,D-transpeptidase/peptidoglycan binding protein [Thermoleophilaceae bacterium]
MRHRSFIALAVALVVMIGGAVAVYAYDSTRTDKVAKGISVSGIDLGGMTRSQARTALDQQLAAPLSRPLVVKYGRERFRLSARRAHLRTNVDAIVDEAMRRSRQGNIVTRSWRSLTGGEVHAQLTPEISYSHAAVERLVRRVKSQLDRPAVDATVSFTSGAFQPVPSHQGNAIRGVELTRNIEAALVMPDGDRVVRAHSKITKPKVTTDQLAQRYPAIIIVDRNAKQLKFYRHLSLNHTYRIAVGMVGLETPAGLYHIQNKQINPPWNVPHSSWAGKLAGKVIPGGAPNNPLKARWLGIFNGAGIHGTDNIASLGTAASHGCIRMSIPDVEQLYPHVPVGAPVYIS